MRRVSFDRFVELMHEHGNRFSFDIETDGLNGRRCLPLMYPLATGRGSAMYCTLVRPSPAAHALLETFFRDSSYKITFHNSSFDLKIVHRFICPLREIRAQIVDTIVLSWLDDNRGAFWTPKPFSLKNLSVKYFKHQMHTLKEIFGESPEAVERNAIEEKARHLHQQFDALYRRRERRKKRFLRQLINESKTRLKDDTTLSRAQKTAMTRDWEIGYREFRYDRERLRNAFHRWLRAKKARHAQLTVVLKRKLEDYALEDAVITQRLFWRTASNLAKRGLDGWSIVELDNRMVANDMEQTGIEVDTEYVKILDAGFGIELDRQREACYVAAAQHLPENIVVEMFDGVRPPKLEFNIGSGPEVSFMLHTLNGAFPNNPLVQFEETKDSIKARTKATAAGLPPPPPRFSTHKKVLTYTDHPLAQNILHYRALEKLRSTYTKQLLVVRGRVHAFFHSSGTDTGRYSSKGPNLQNIPSRTEMGKRIRRAFKARDGAYFISLDLSQIELRIAAIVCKEANLLDVYSRYAVREDGSRDYTIGDVHKATQDRLQAICPFEVIREYAKNANFGLLYGQSPKSFSTLFRIPIELAQQIHTAFYTSYPSITAMLAFLREQWDAGARIICLPFSGRRRLYDTRRVRTQTDDDEAPMWRDNFLSPGALLNTIVQGTAADVLKRGIAAFWRHVVLRPEFRKSVFPLMQVHDEFNVEVVGDIEHAICVARLMRYCFEYSWWRTPIPLLADVRIVTRYDEAKKGEREILDVQGQPVMVDVTDKDGTIKRKPKTEMVLPEANAQIKYLTEAQLAWCRTIVPAYEPIEILEDLVQFPDTRTGD